MAINSSSNVDPIIESHEERINRVEDGVSKLSTQLATNTERLDSLSEKLDLMADKITQKVESCINSLSQGLIAHSEEDRRVHANVDKLSEKSERIDNRVDRLEEGVAKSRKKWDLIKKIGLPLLIALGGVIAERLGSLIWTWMSHG